jgi:hypothetical protein
MMIFLGFLLGMTITIIYFEITKEKNKNDK